MGKIKKPSPPEHIVIVDTNVLWHKDKGYIVNPDVDSFWDKHSDTFPMKLILPEVVKGELLFQQTTSALKLLEKANQEISDISRITEKKYSHRVTHERIKKEVEERFSGWLASRKAEVKSTPTLEIDWNNVIQLAIWRKPPFIADPENQKNEKGFRDAMILETVASVCRFYSSEVNIAFICNDFALRKAADERLGKIESFSTYESLKDFESFIELTKKNLTERFVKSILSRAKEKFHDEKDRDCLIYKDNFYQRLRESFVLRLNLRYPKVSPRIHFLDNQKVHGNT